MLFRLLCEPKRNKDRNDFCFLIRSDIRPKIPGQTKSKSPRQILERPRAPALVFLAKKKKRTAASRNPFNAFVAPTEAGTKMVTSSLSFLLVKEKKAAEKRNLRKRRGFLLVFVRH